MLPQSFSETNINLILKLDKDTKNKIIDQFLNEIRYEIPITILAKHSTTHKKQNTIIKLVSFQE
jgi:hypothetical protein